MFNVNSTPKPLESPPLLVLGSTSPYRKELLTRLRVPFSCLAPLVDETPMANEPPRQLAMRLAAAKAQAVALTFSQDQDVVVIGSDQVAELNGVSIGKPGDHAHAMDQLRTMRGQHVLFHSAVSVTRPLTGFMQTTLSTVSVQFRADYSDAEMDLYLQLDQPYDCAGSAKVESLGIVLLDRVESDDPTALIGLPLIATTRLLREAGYPLFEKITP